MLGFTIQPLESGVIKKAQDQHEQGFNTLRNIANGRSQ